MSVCAEAPLSVCDPTHSLTLTHGITFRGRINGYQVGHLHNLCGNNEIKKKKTTALIAAPNAAPTSRTFKSVGDHRDLRVTGNATFV